MKGLFFTLTIIILAFAAKSQGLIDKIKYYHEGTTSDTSFIKGYDRKITFAGNLEHRNETFRINNNDGSGRKIYYHPNIAYKLGFAASKNGIRVAIAIPIPQYTHIYGKSKAFAINVKTQTSMMNWGYEFDFARYQGLYVGNPNQVVNGWKYGTAYPQRDDFKTTTFSFNTHIVLSNKVSMKAAFMQTEAQKKTAGGFSVGMGFNYSGFSSGKGLVTTGQIDNYQDISDMNRAGFWNFNIIPGYIYSWVYNDLYISGMAALGLGPQFRYYKNGIVPHFKFGVSAYPVGRLSIGYNKDIYYAAFVYENTNFAYKVADSKVNYISENISFTAGVRL